MGKREVGAQPPTIANATTANAREALAKRKHGARMVGTPAIEPIRDALAN
jgi:hypothetical protein